MWINNGNGYTFYEIQPYEEGNMEYNKRKFIWKSIQKGKLPAIKYGMRKMKFGSRKELDQFLKDKGYDKKTEFDTSPDENKNMIDHIEGTGNNDGVNTWNEPYDVKTNNCAHFVADVFEKGNIKLSRDRTFSSSSLGGLAAIVTKVRNLAAPNEIHNRLHAKNINRIIK